MIKRASSLAVAFCFASLACSTAAFGASPDSYNQYVRYAIGDSGFTDGPLIDNFFPTYEQFRSYDTAGAGFDESGAPLNFNVFGDSYIYARGVVTPSPQVFAQVHSVTSGGGTGNYTLNYSVESQLDYYFTVNAPAGIGFADSPTEILLQISGYTEHHIIGFGNYPGIPSTVIMDYDENGDPFTYDPYEVNFYGDASTFSRLGVYDRGPTFNTSLYETFSDTGSFSRNFTLRSIDGDFRGQISLYSSVFLDPFADAYYRGGAVSDLTATAFLDPVIEIDPAFLAAHPGYTLSFSAGVQNGAQAAGVPEPASWSMMIAGFGFVGALSRRRRRFAA